MEISVDSDCKLLLYADDSAIFSHKDPNVVAQKLGCILDSCNKWLVDNKLSLHLGKTECVLFGSKRKLKKSSNFSVQCASHSIPAQASVKYLGIEIDQHVSGEKIAKYVLRKANARLSSFTDRASISILTAASFYVLRSFNVHLIMLPVLGFLAWILILKTSFKQLRTKLCVISQIRATLW